MAKPICTDPIILAERKERRRIQNAARQKKHYEANRERRIDEQKARNTKNPLTAQLRNAKAQAALRGIPFDLTEEELDIPDICPVLGIPIGFNKSMKDRDYSISLDRLDNTLGYTASNVRVISYRANKLKSNATIDELEKVLNYMKYGK